MSRICMAALLCALLLVTAGCGSDGPQPQRREVSPTLSGVATYDDSAYRGGVSVKGTAGTARTTANSTGTGQYTISLQDLTGPYILRAHSDLYAVALQPGVANVTPLTTLVLAQLMGQDPGVTYAGFGGTAAPAAGFTEDSLQSAQQKVVRYLHDTLGVEVKTGTAGFTTTPFEMVAGDPMFDTILAVDAQLTARSMTFTQFADQLAGLARLCITERIEITVSSATTDFCPAGKSANPETDDPGILDYVFTDPQNNSLTFKVRGDAVLAGQYVTTAGYTYGCSGSGCTGVTLGAAADDDTRDILFAATLLTGASGGGTVALSGTLKGAVPGVVLPVLQCTNNRFIVILPERQVSSACVNPADYAADPFTLGGVLDYEIGPYPPVMQYVLNGAYGSAPDPSRPQVAVYMKGNEGILQITFTRIDPETGHEVHFHCEADSCKGVTLGPETVNTDYTGPDTPFRIRDVTLDHTVLSGINDDGSPTGTQATLIAAMTIEDYDDPYSFMWPPSPPTPCASGSDAILMTVASGPFNLCSAQPHASHQQPNGDLTLVLADDNYFGANVTITLRNGAVYSVTYTNNAGPSAYYGCSGAQCTGVSLASDGSGGYTASFKGTILYVELAFGFTGPNTQVLDGGPVVFSPLR